MTFLQLRTYLRIPILGCLLLWGACSPQRQKELSPIQVAFQLQLDKACDQRMGIYQKTVSHFVEGQPSKEEMIKDTLGSLKACPFEEELSFLLKQAYDDPIMKDKFVVESVGDTMIARLIPSEMANSEIQLQKTLLSKQGTLQYVETHIRRDTWLYKTEIKGWLKFDTLGRYQTHEIESFMDVATVEKPFHALIQGQLKSDE